MFSSSAILQKFGRANHLRLLCTCYFQYFGYTLVWFLFWCIWCEHTDNKFFILANTRLEHILPTMQKNILWTGIEYHSLENCLITFTDKGIETISSIIGSY